MSPKSRIYAVTGGGSGIAAATCRLLAEGDARIICVADISSQGFANLKDDIAKISPSTEVHCTVVDVGSPTAVEDWIRGILTNFGDLHGAANVAGVPQAFGTRGSPAILEETDEMWHQIMRVNLNGVFFCTRAEVSAMKDLPREDRSIVNVASIVALNHAPDAFAYRTSKAAVAKFSVSVAKDTKPLGIRVNVVSPAATDTPLLEKFLPGPNMTAKYVEAYRKEGRDFLSAEEVAGVIVWLLRKDSSAVWGSHINVGGGLP